MDGFNLRWEDSIEPLDQDRVYKHLESGFKIGGFDAPDLLLSLGAGAFSNLIFGQTALGGVLTIFIPSISLLTLYEPSFDVEACFMCPHSTLNRLSIDYNQLFEM